MAELPKFQQHQYKFAAHIRDPQQIAAPDDIEDRRMAIYRELFYNNVEGFLKNSFPVIRKLSNDDQWHDLVRDFFSHHQSASPYFLDIPKEFLDFLNTERVNEEDPPFLRELAHYEWAEMAVSVLEDNINEIEADAGGDLLEGVPVLSPTAWPLAYEYPVHQIKPDFRPEQPGEIHTFIVIYRDRNDKVGFIEINPVTAHLLELMQNSTSMTGREMLTAVANDIGHPDTQVVINGGLDILNNLRDHDIVLGTKI